VKNYLFFIFTLFSLDALSQDKAFILLDGTKSDYAINNDLNFFKSQNINSELLKKHFSFKENQNKSILSWLKKNQFIVMGNKFDYSFCLDVQVKRKMNIPCNENNNPRVIQAKTGVKSFLLDKNFSLFFPKATLDKINATGGFILSSGRYIRLKNYSPVIKLENELKKSSKRLDEESYSLYRFAHYVGLTRIKEIFRSRKKDSIHCGKVYGKNFSCNTNVSGSYSITGLLLSEFAKSCLTCSDKSKLSLNYYAANYLLRVPGRNDFQILGRKIFNQNKDNFKDKMAMEYIYLDKIYKWALKSNLSAH
jgi:hypothetical protein